MKTLSSFALKALSAVVVEGQTARIVDTLDRKLYLEVNDALVALGGKWSKKFKAHVFDKTADEISDALEQVMLSGGFVDKKQDLGQFFTPAALADRLVALAEILPDMRVLEPSAGQGQLLRAIWKRHYGLSVVAAEIDPSNVANLRASANPCVVVEGDFLQMKPPIVCPEGFDRIVMNPPFARGADIDHVLHAWKFLKPGGRLVSVMSAGPTFRQDKKSAEFRAFVKRNRPSPLTVPASQDTAGVKITNSDGFLTLPGGSFAASGTNVNTVVVVLEKTS